MPHKATQASARNITHALRARKVYVDPYHARFYECTATAGQCLVVKHVASGQQYTTWGTTEECLRRAQTFLTARKHR